MSNVEDTTLSEFKSVFKLYITKIGSNLPLEEYLSIDDNVVVVGYPTDLEILENLKRRDENKDDDAFFDDTPATVPTAHQPSNKEMRIMLQKRSEYVCSKESMSNDMYRALQILENFVDNELFKVTSQKLHFFKNK